MFQDNSTFCHDQGFCLCIYLHFIFPQPMDMVAVGIFLNYGLYFIMINLFLLLRAKLGLRKSLHSAGSPHSTCYKNGGQTLHQSMHPPSPKILLF